MSEVVNIGDNETHFSLKTTGERKRLGQYFTGDKLARLLVAITDSKNIQSVIDPMCGSGDMLLAVENIAHPSLFGIEIDKAAYQLSSERLKNSKVFLTEGDAFEWNTVKKLPYSNFDLVITNPPYVRYQTLNNSENHENSSSDDIRKGLLEIANRLNDLEDDDRRIFISIIENYSGLSDLAIPSWILCSMLTKVGGTLAMVVPDSWLNREYAQPIHYLLLKLFQITVVVEDVNRSWFQTAQVKTSLVVVKRIHRIEDISKGCTDKSYLHIELPKSSANELSLVGNLFPLSTCPEKDFSNEISELKSREVKYSRSGISFSHRSLQNKLTNLVATAKKTKWFKFCELKYEFQNISSVYSESKFPQALLELFPSIDPGRFTTIDAVGCKVGQGLRTGANEFFYCNILSEEKENCLVAPSKKLEKHSLLLPKNALKPVLRKQNEIASGYILKADNLMGRVLLLDQFIHPEDIKKISNEILFDLKPMPPALAEYVTKAANTNLGNDAFPKFIPQLSAVKTNENKPSLSNGKKPRFWYMLPPLVKRHLPDMFVARVNNLHPKVMMNSLEETVIDANFSTLWLEKTSEIDSFALLACFNSSWITATMELTATVMGGGALKLEASHIRNLPIPNLSKQQWLKLSLLGKSLVNNEDNESSLHKADELISEAIFGNKLAQSSLTKIKEMNREKLEARKHK